MSTTEKPETTQDPVGIGLAASGQALASGQVWLDRRLEFAFNELGWDQVDLVMHSEAGHCMRVLDDRENWWIDLTLEPESSPKRFYLKKHHVRTRRSRLEACGTAARVEAQAVKRLNDDGIPTMQVAAYGEQLHSDGRLNSFLLTENLEGYLPLDDFLRERFTVRRLHVPKRRDAELMTLLTQVADIAARFHNSGYNHRDLYCCHFFIKEIEAGQGSDEAKFDVRLIDLQRVQHRRHFRRRWIVKDLAQLAYSAPRDRIKCTQKLAFLRRYLGVKKLRPRDKRLIREVLAKQQKMERRLGVE